MAFSAALLDHGDSRRQWVVWDVTDLVADWASGGLSNYGLLLKLVDGQEDYGSSGPLFPSSIYADASLRPKLTVWYFPP